MYDQIHFHFFFIWLNYCVVNLQIWYDMIMNWENNTRAIHISGIPTYKWFFTFIYIGRYNLIILWEKWTIKQHHQMNIFFFFLLCLQWKNSLMSANYVLIGNLFIEWVDVMSINFVYVDHRFWSIWSPKNESFLIIVLWNYYKMCLNNKYYWSSCKYYINKFFF